MKNNIFSNLLLRSIMMMLMMGWMGSAWAQTYEEKAIYSTDFTDWTKVDRKMATNKVINKQTDFGEAFTFTLNGVGIEPKGTNSKFSSYTGYLQTAKYTSEYSASEPSAVTSPLKSITKIVLTQAATGPSRGIKVSVKGDGDADWVVIHNISISKTSGENLTLNVNRTNCQIKFENFTLNQNAYVTNLSIYGNVEKKSEVNINYYDVDGTSLIGTEKVAANSKLTYRYGADDVHVSSLGNNYKFRGWFSGTGVSSTKVPEGTELTVDLNLYAKATPIETADYGTEYTYDLTKNYWYQEDHELIDIIGGEWNADKNSWYFENGGTIQLQVAQYASIYITDASQAQTIRYDGGTPTTYTYTVPAGGQIKNIYVRNIKLVKVSFDKKTMEGETPATILCDKDGRAMMPYNAYLYREGWTFEAWTDGTNQYEVGKSYPFDTDVTLYPQLTQNTVDITDANKEMVVRWPFALSEAPEINMQKGSGTKDYTRSGTIYIDESKQELHDVKMTMDASDGKAKIDNTVDKILTSTGKGAQFNENTILTFPAVYGMKVTLKASTIEYDGTEAYFNTDANDAKITVTDENGFAVSDADITYPDNKTMVVTYKGDGTLLSVKFVKPGSNSDKGYGCYEYLEATYPVLPNVVSTNVITNPDFHDATKYPNEKVENAGATTLTSNATHANTGKRFKVGDVVTLLAEPGYGYTFKGFRKKGSTEFLEQKGTETPLSCTYTFTDADIQTYGNIIPVEAVYERQAMKKVIVRSADVTMGSVTLSPQPDNFYLETYETSDDGTIGKQKQVECWYVEGTEVTADNYAETNYMLSHWTMGNSDAPISADNSYTFTIGSSTEVRTILIAHFKQGYRGTVIFDISRESGVHVDEASDSYKGAGSMQPDALENVQSFVIPTNYTFYKKVDDNDQPTTNNYTLRYWYKKGDENQHYELGKQYSFSSEGETLTLLPYFEYNPTTHENRTNSPVIRVDFGRKPKDYADLTSQTIRKVCAQSVNIDNNQNVFWTTQVYVEVRDGEESKPHWRDVAMWVNTGSRGYLRNTDYDQWALIGPGTTFWTTAGAGTKISMLTYSPLTTTTIDGVVPTLDQARTDTERKASGQDHIYVYSYTTQSTDDFIPIVIGDDHTFFQWMEISTPSANLTTLHVEVNNEARAIIDKIEPKAEDGFIQELESGDHSFHKGERVKLTFHRKKGYVLKKISGLYQQDEEGSPINLLEMKEDGTVDMIQYDFTTHINVKPNSDGSWGTATGDEKTMWVLRKTDEKTYNSEDSIRTQYELEFDISANRSMRLEFEESSNTYYVTYNPGSYASGTPPEAEWVEAGDLFKIPRNQTLYFEGNTLDHWIDEAKDESGSTPNSYLIGQRYHAPAENIRLFPLFHPNQFNVLDIATEATATWNFTKDDNAPTINYEKASGILVTQLTVPSILQPDGDGTEVVSGEGGVSIDLKIDLDGSKGKFNNTNERTERIQINSGSIIRFPSTPDCVATLRATEDDKSVKIAGQTTTVKQTGDASLASVTCSGATALQTVEFTEGIYSKSFSVTYKPQSTEQVKLASLTCEGVTYTRDQLVKMMDENENQHIVLKVSPWKNEDEAMPEVTGTATNNGIVEATKATILAPSSAVTVRSKSGVIVETYVIDFEFTTPTSMPEYVQLTVNGKTYTDTSNEIWNVPQSGVVKVKFNRTMKSVNIDWKGITHTAETAQEQVFKYWDMPDGETIQLAFVPGTETGIFEDIYGLKCQQTLTLTLHIKQKADLYHHHQFDFIVGEDGDMDEAIKAANGEATGKKYNNTKSDEVGEGEEAHRYYIFVPDGDYELTGNSTVSWNPPSKEDDNPKDETGKPRPDMNGKNNHMTYVKKPNISLIGQSKEGVTIYNHPVIEGISYTATLDINQAAKDFYAQDLTLENRFDYWGSMSGQASGGAGRAGAFIDRANRTTLKNVGMWSWQDTYYSANGGAYYRGYMEDCDLAGVVDWICGSGSIWFERCNLLVRDRSGNNICAPHTETEEDMGYVFNNCNIKPADENPTQLKGNDWTLARPWGKSPACTFLNTRMYTQPRYYGWGRMTTGLKVRFQEFRSMDGDGNLINLNTRSIAACTPAAGSYDCVLVDTTGYNIRNVLGGTDAYEPHRLCQQINAKTTTATEEERAAQEAQAVAGVKPIEWDAQLEMSDEMLQWNGIEQALCYFVFKRVETSGKWLYVANTTENSINLNNYGTGFYCVRAANQRGGLGKPTDAIQYIVSDPYSLEIKKQVGDVEGYGWSTICLPFNAKKPEDVTVYAATAHGSSSASDKVSDYKLTLSEVSVIDSLKGYVVYGPVGTHTFRPTSRTCDKATILRGNATEDAIPATNKACYIMANKTWGLGFYKFSGTTLAAYRAWLPEDMVKEENQQALASGKKAISFVFDNGATAVRLPRHPDTSAEGTSDEVLYNLSGQKVDKPTLPGIYISRGKGKVIRK